MLNLGVLNVQLLLNLLFILCLYIFQATDGKIRPHRHSVMSKSSANQTS